MQQIIYDATKIKVYEALEKWCQLAKKDADFLAGFWKRILENQEVYQEFVYYLEHHELIAQYMVKGYSMIDLYVCQMDRYNIQHDIGKNDVRCNKEKMVLQAFDVMLKMSENPDEIIKKLQSGEGMDKM
jgi:hypothetical protein